MALAVFLQEGKLPSNQLVSECVPDPMQEIRETPTQPNTHIVPPFSALESGEVVLLPAGFDTVISLPLNLTTSLILDIQKHFFKSQASLSFQARQFAFCLINK